MNVPDAHLNVHDAHQNDHVHHLSDGDCCRNDHAHDDYRPESFIIKITSN